MIRRPPLLTLTDTLFTYTTLCLSGCVFYHEYFRLRDWRRDWLRDWLPGVRSRRSRSPSAGARRLRRRLGLRRLAADRSRSGVARARPRPAARPEGGRGRRLAGRPDTDGAGGPRRYRLCDRPRPSAHGAHLAERRRAGRPVRSEARRVGRAWVSPGRS